MRDSVWVSFTTTLSVVFVYSIQVPNISKSPTSSIIIHHGNALITPSKATNAIAFAGNALIKHGKKPLQ